LNDLALRVAGMTPVASTPIQPRVLVVEDPPEGALSIARDIAGWFDVRAEADGVSAWLALLCDPAIRAVIADVDTHAWFGSEVLLERMRVSGIARLRSVPVIVLAADGPEAFSRARRLAPEATAFLARSTPHAELVERIGALIHRLPAPPRRPPAPSPQRMAPTLSVDLAPRPAFPRDEESPTMARYDSLNKILKQLQTETPGVEASALISEDGLMIASALPQDLDDMRVAGMTATLLNLGTRAATELRRGDVREVIVRGEAGYAVTISAGRGAVLLVLAGDTTPLGLIFFDMREAVKSIKTVL